MQNKCKIIKNVNGLLPYHIQPATFFLSVIFIFGFVSVTLPFTTKFGDLFTRLLNLATGNFGWFLILTMNVLLFYSVYLAFSKYSEVRIGGQNAEPEFTTLAWYSMLFSAGDRKSTRLNSSHYS